MITTTRQFVHFDDDEDDHEDDDCYDTRSCDDEGGQEGGKEKGPQSDRLTERNLNVYNSMS